MRLLSRTRNATKQSCGQYRTIGHGAAAAALRMVLELPLVTQTTIGCAMEISHWWPIRSKRIQTKVKDSMAWYFSTTSDSLQ